MGKTQFELLAEIDATEADLRGRAEEANAAALENRRKRQRAVEAFKAAAVADDQDAQAEAQALIKELDAEHELLLVKERALMEVLEKGSGTIPGLAREIKKLAEAEARERRKEWDRLDAQLQTLTAEYLTTVATMGKVYMQSAGIPWERARNFLPRGQDVLEGRVLPSVNHENQRGPIYVLTPGAINAAFRRGVNGNV